MNQEWPWLDEDEEDVDSSTSKALVHEIRQTVVFTIDWSVSSLIEQLQEGNIDLQPQYQRRDAWSLAKKSKLIESLILGLPVPQLVLAELPSAKGTFVVLDGKQRLTAIHQFIGGVPNSTANDFRLRDLPILTDLNGLSYAAMGHDQVRAFLNQPVRTVILRGWQTDEFLHLVFHRLNSNVVPLSPQELRQALIRGPFLPFLNEFSAQSEQVQGVLKLSGPDFRMRDSELLLRLLSFSLYFDQYRGNLREFLDESARRINREWQSIEPEVTRRLRMIENHIDEWAVVMDGLHNVGRRTTMDGKIDRRFNRAILDAQIGAAENNSAHRVLVSAPWTAREAFEQIQQADRDFQKAIESTTKTAAAVGYRRNALAEAIIAKGG